MVLNTYRLGDENRIAIIYRAGIAESKGCWYSFFIFLPTSSKHLFEEVKKRPRVMEKT